MAHKSGEWQAVGSAFFGKFYVLNHVEDESLQTYVYVCLTFEACQL